MNTKQIKEELATVFGMPARAKESTKRFQERLAVAVTKATDEQLAKLSDEAASYINSELKLGIKTDKAAEAEGEQAPAAETKTSEPKTPAAPKKKRNVMETIKKVSFANPKADLDQLLVLLKEQGVESSRASVQTIRADFFHSIEVLKGLGAYKEA